MPRSSKSILNNQYLAQLAWELAIRRRNKVWW
jgi:hypothetical protein